MCTITQQNEVIVFDKRAYTLCCARTKFLCCFWTELWRQIQVPFNVWQHTLSHLISGLFLIFSFHQNPPTYMIVIGNSYLKMILIMSVISPCQEYPLHMAAGQGKLVTLKQLVSKGANINSKDDNGVSVQNYWGRLLLIWTQARLILWLPPSYWSQFYRRAYHFILSSAFSLGILLGVYILWCQTLYTLD